MEPFAPVLRGVVRTAFTGGLQALAGIGRTIEAIKTDGSARSRFLRGCHYGYDKAQQRIAWLVVDLQHRIDVSKAELAQLRRDRDAARQTDVQTRLVVLSNRQLALRRVADALLCAITGMEDWILRRLVLDWRIRSIDPAVLKTTLAEATRRNSESRLQFSLVSDLTTVVQIGDLVEVAIRPGSRECRLVELKGGEVNTLLSNVLASPSSEAAAQALDSEIAATLGEKAVVQARRMQRQMFRLGEVAKIITTDEGLDPALRMPVRMMPERVVTEHYMDAIQRVVGGARQKGVSAASLPGGLHLVGMRRDEVRGDYIGAVGHVLLHLREPERPCRLNAGTEEGMAEFRHVQEGPPFLDLVAHSMRAQWGRPVYLWMESEKAVDLVVGDIRVFAQFDMTAFFALAARAGIQMTWVTGKEAERLKRMKVSDRILGSPNAWGIRAITPDGKRQTLLSGSVARVIADLMTPRQLLDLIKRWPEEAERMGVVLE
jgi:hypothetical protein